MGRRALVIYQERCYQVDSTAALTSRGHPLPAVKGCFLFVIYASKTYGSAAVVLFKVTARLESMKLCNCTRALRTMFLVFGLRAMQDQRKGLSRGRLSLAVRNVQWSPFIAADSEWYDIFTLRCPTIPQHAYTGTLIAQYIWSEWANLQHCSAYLEYFKKSLLFVRMLQLSGVHLISLSTERCSKLPHFSEERNVVLFLYEDVVFMKD